MTIVVQKYGGSSVASLEKLERVAEKVVATRNRGASVVVVISAMGGSTDQLLSLAHQIDPNPPRRELDMLLSTGERVSMALLSMAIQKRGCEAISFTGSQSGIITNDRHYNARIIEVRPFRLEDELARGRIVIVAGYQGMSYRREITTLGRGGSDTTAIALAAALGASRAEIYSDVDGIYSADPRIVLDAEHLAALSYAEMQEMAEAGAKVLNAQAVEYAKRAGIRIHARATQGSERESVIGDEKFKPHRPAVVGRKRMSVCTVLAADTGLSDALLKLQAAGLSVCSVSMDSDALKVLVDTDVPDWVSTSEAARAHLPDAQWSGPMGCVSVVAEGLHATQNAMVRCHKVLVAEGLTPVVILTGPMHIACWVQEGVVDRLVDSLHAAFAGPPASDPIATS